MMKFIRRLWESVWVTLVVWVILAAIQIDEHYRRCRTAIKKDEDKYER